jgi:hypothetical protein
MVLSPSGRVNKSLDNKEETTYKRAKEKEAWEKHKGVSRYLDSQLQGIRSFFGGKGELSIKYHNSSLGLTESKLVDGQDLLNLRGGLHWRAKALEWAQARSCTSMPSGDRTQRSSQLCCWQRVMTVTQYCTFCTIETWYSDIDYLEVKVGMHLQSI